MSRHCIICARPASPYFAVDAAHVDPKKMGGRGPKAPADAHDTFDLCSNTGGNTDPSTCHGGNEAGLMDIRRSEAGNAMFLVRADLESRESDVLADRLAQRLKVKRGLWYFAPYEDVDFDSIDAPREAVEAIHAQESLGEVLHVCEEAISENRRAGGRAYAQTARAVAISHEAHVTAFGKRDGEERWREWTREQEISEKYDDAGNPVAPGRTALHRLLRVGSLLPHEDEYAVLSIAKQQALADAVAKGAGSPGELLESVQALSASSFRAEVFGEKEHAARALRCPLGRECEHLAV